MSVAEQKQTDRLVCHMKPYEQLSLINTTFLSLQKVKNKKHLQKTKQNTTVCLEIFQESRGGAF